MRRLYFAFLAPLLLCGCQETWVRQKAGQLIAQTPDLYYEQVLNNLAMISTNPGALPYFGLPQSGSNTDSRQLQSNYVPGWDFITNTSAFAGRFLFDKQTALFQGQYTAQESFQLQPLTNPDKLVLMQIAYRKAAGQGISVDEERYLNKATLKTQPTKKDDPASDVLRYHEWIVPGWYCVAHRRKDVPKSACYVGRYCDTWIWVPEDHLADLTHFTLAILDIATRSSGVQKVQMVPATRGGAQEKAQPQTWEYEYFTVPREGATPPYPPAPTVVP